MIIGSLDCGSLGWQEVELDFKSGQLISVYFTWDRDRINNLLHDLSTIDISKFEEAFASQPNSRFLDPLYIAKMSAENEQV